VPELVEGFAWREHQPSTSSGTGHVQARLQPPVNHINAIALGPAFRNSDSMRSASQDWSHAYERENITPDIPLPLPDQGDGQQ